MIELKSKNQKVQKEQIVELLAFRKWHMHYAPHEADRLKPRVDWLRTCRRALLLTHETVARRLGRSKQSYWKLENREKEAKISIKDLRSAAAALDCELVYFLRPKSKKKFALIIWEMLYARAKNDPNAVRAAQYEPAWAANALAAAAIRLFHQDKFRKEMGWSYLKTTRYNHNFRATRRVKPHWEY